MRASIRLLIGSIYVRVTLASLALASLALSLASLTTLAAAQAPVVPGCEKVNLSNPVAMQGLVNAHGLKNFANPPEPATPPTDAANRLDLVVDYATLPVAGCTAHLRTYNGAIVGPTIRAKPGDTIHLRLINRLPSAPATHPQVPEPAGHGGGHGHPFSFNLTNLHTHGLNVAPQGPGPADPKTGRVPFESDNALLELGPGEQQDYRIEIHKDHPAGTFWYHAHLHGSTSVQLSSGMAGALIIEGGTAEHGDLDSVPVIGRVKANEKIFVLQQLLYDEQGQVETFTMLNTIPRPTLVNGQLVPVIRMRPGEIQRWRFIHAGVLENVPLALDDHPIHEVATDGISLGRSVPWAEAPDSGVRGENNLLISPGYRTDILVKARTPEAGHRYFLRKLRLNAPASLQAQERAIARGAAGPPALTDVLPVDPSDFAPSEILAELVIEGPEVTGQDLPGPAELGGVTPKDLPDIKPEEITATLQLDPAAPRTVPLQIMTSVSCSPADGKCVKPCPPGSPCLATAFVVDEHQFSPANVWSLKLNTGGKPTAAQWTIKAFGQHPFHIHVNPFQVDRKEPNAAGVMEIKPVWKDTILAVGTSLPPLRMRYKRFKGKFVLHCHILLHEDQGMMQMVEIVD